MDPDGRSRVTASEKLKLCRDVAEGISVLHANGTGKNTTLSV
jgi:hypothetical protein